MFWHTLRKNLESLPFCYHNLIISHQPAAILIILIPWDNGSMHGEVTAALNCSYWLSMITEDQQCVHLWVYFISCLPGQGKRRWGEIERNFFTRNMLLLDFTNISAFSQKKVWQKYVVALNGLQILQTFLSIWFGVILLSSKDQKFGLSSLCI